MQCYFEQKFPREKIEEKQEEIEEPLILTNEVQKDTSTKKQSTDQNLSPAVRKIVADV